MLDGTQLIDIKEVADTFGKSIESIRKYKNFGIIRVSDKRGNKDLFDREEILKIRDRLRSLQRRHAVLHGPLSAKPPGQANTREVWIGRWTGTGLSNPCHSGAARQPIPLRG